MPSVGEIASPIASVLGVCGNMVLFSIGTAFVIAPLSGNWKLAVTAATELAMGMRAVQAAPLPVMATVAGFSGLCILWQNAQVLRACGISLGELFCIKAMHALFSFVLCGLWMYAAEEKGFASGGGTGEIRLQVSAIAAGVLMVGILAGKLRNFCAKKAAVSGCRTK